VSGNFGDEVYVPPLLAPETQSSVSRFLYRLRYCGAVRIIKIVLETAFENGHVMVEQTERLNTPCNEAAAASVERKQWRALMGPLLN